MRFSLALVVLALALVSTAPVHAQRDKTEAAKLFDKGRTLVEQGKQDEACDLFEQSFLLDPQPGTALNLGDCAERAGKLREAWRLFDLAGREFEKLNKLVQAKFARDRAAAIAPKLAIVIVKIADPSAPGLVVKIGGREMSIGPEIVERLEAGAIEVTVAAPGKQTFSTTAKGIVGQHAIVEVPPLAAAATVVEPPPPPPPQVDTARPPRDRKRVLIAYGVGGAGVLAFVTSGVLGYTAKNIYDSAFESGQCTEDMGTRSCSSQTGIDTVNRAFRRADIGTGFAIGGVLLVAGGAVLYFTAPRREPATEPSITVSPTAGRSSAGISISGTF